MKWEVWISSPENWPAGPKDKDVSRQEPLNLLSQIHSHETLMLIMRIVFRSSANTCPFVGQNVCIAFTLQSNTMMHSSHRKKKNNKSLLKKKTLLVLFLVTIHCLNVWEIWIWPVIKCLTPSVVTLLKAFKINYLLKEEVFSADRAQTCTDVKPFQKLSGFHLFHIVNHLHLRKKMTKISNSMKSHLDTSKTEVYEY